MSARDEFAWRAAVTAGILHPAPSEPVAARSVAGKIYPRLHSDAEWRAATTVRREPQPVQGASAASRIYPNLSGGKA